MKLFWRKLKIECPKVRNTKYDLVNKKRFDPLNRIFFIDSSNSELNIFMTDLTTQIIMIIEHGGIIIIIWNAFYYQPQQKTKLNIEYFQIFAMVFSFDDWKIYSRLEKIYFWNGFENRLRDFDALTPCQFSDRRLQLNLSIYSEKDNSWSCSNSSTRSLLQMQWNNRIYSVQLTLALFVRM